MKRPRPMPLAEDEPADIAVGIQSVFKKVRKLYKTIAPVYVKFGFTPPSAGVAARDLSEKIEDAIIQHCESFEKGVGHCDLSRFDQDWEVKICKGSGLTINQSKVVNGEHYIVVNYATPPHVTAIWIVWDAQDRFFSPRVPNSNARRLNRHAAIAMGAQIEVLFTSAK
jgi:hypothetical protein